MFDPNAAPETPDFDYKLLPEGGYRVVIADCQFKYKQGDVNSNWFNVRFDILPHDGVSFDYEFAGRRVYTNFTWENKNPKAIEIGRSQLADLMFAVNAGAFEFPADLPPMLQNKELFVEIYDAERYDKQGRENKIRGYWSVSGRQRKKNPKDIPKPPSAEAIAKAPPKPRLQGSPSTSGGYQSAPFPGDEDSPF
jgi:hypothetical protein